MGAEPVEYFEDGGEEHYKRDVKGEARRCASTMDGIDLIGIGCDRRGY